MEGVSFREFLLIYVFECSVSAHFSVLYLLYSYANPLTLLKSGLDELGCLLF